MSSYQYFDRLERTLKQHEEWRLGECLNLIPSENRTSRLSRSMYLRDFGNRYTAPDKFYRGTRYLDEATTLTQEVARKVFNARYADVRPLSGHVADEAVLMALAEPGDKVLSVSPANGGYPGVSHEGLGPILGLKNVYFPYDDGLVNIEPRGAKSLIKQESPSVAFFGASYIVFPHPTRELSDVHDGTHWVYDASHVLGLIAGGEFQDPLREGCSLMVGSTHKSFPGPQGGIILSNREDVFEKVASKIFPGIVDNYHLDRVAALAVSLLEMLEFGKAYAQSMVKNAQALAKSLADRGVSVRGAGIGYTKSHQVLLDYDERVLLSLADRLERSNI
ncbi:MAG TPA: serine hydroxymethyltransferase, partial [Nitrososphaerales archaeon]|nr:serine hydroxymethyltransferase [Nitrososphaerales archaeon]